MNFETIASQNTNGNVSQFWRASAIWLHKPHLINRRILASTDVSIAEIKRHDPPKIFLQLEELDDLSDVLGLEIDENFSKLIHALNVESLRCCDCNDLPDDDSKGIYVLFKKLFPRNTNKFSQTLDVTIIDKQTNSIISFGKRLSRDKLPLSPEWWYKIQYVQNDLVTVSVRNADPAKHASSIKWLCEHLLSRLLKWMSPELENAGNPSPLTTDSLSLVSVEGYTALYNDLKKKYGMEMVKIWPENTDPAKFVYEDIAIASYLLLLWENERKSKGTEVKQSFLDLGCGNGLLVHILTSEGHPGLGIDLRRRKIWDLFPKTTQLKVETIVPSSSSLYPEVNWLIGNHSDELTPWIPVIAARSSYNCRFFLLPCCAYEFDGRKYQRDDASKSQYFEYVHYIKSICEKCGFRTDMDKLRIPSTKRVCLVGWERTYSEGEYESRDKLIREIIDERSMKKIDDATRELTQVNDDQWSGDFKPRDSLEVVRNCTKLDKDLIRDIINIVTTELLRKVRMVPLKREPNTMWNAGGQIELHEIARLVPVEMLKRLKNECGGLQTLLKNNSHIFQVVRGKVQFRMPGCANPMGQRNLKKNTKTMRKVRPCWFHENHPHGCPIFEVDCNFKHASRKKTPVEIE